MVVVEVVVIGMVLMVVMVEVVVLGTVRVVVVLKVEMVGWRCQERWW